MSTKTTVNWTAYAYQYDLMAQHNPFYQELLQHCFKAVSEWQLQPNDIIADFAAGTGNFSIALAKIFPHLTVLHVELNEQMIQVAENKAHIAGLKNWKVVRLDLTQDLWPIPKIAGATIIHALYSLSQPKDIITRICTLLKPGGHVYAANCGRPMKVADWGKALIWHSLRANGVLKTLSLLARTGSVRRENRHIAECQRSGQFWLHDLAEFRAAFEAQGMAIELSLDNLYRGYDDIIVAKRMSMDFDGKL